MLTIIIGSKKGVVTTADGRRMKVFPAFVEKRGKAARLNHCENPGEVDSVEMVFARDSGASLVRERLELPSLLRRATVLFLNHYQWKQDIAVDCYAFACMAHEVHRHDKFFMLSYWDLSPIRHVPDVGQVIFLMGNMGRPDMFFAHAAVYLGRGMFISVYGAGGQLEFSTLRDMVRDFRADDVLLATPYA